MKLKRKFAPFNTAEGTLFSETEKSWTLKPASYKWGDSIVHNISGLTFRKVTWEISGE